jgi:hypothetical protein
MSTYQFDIIMDDLETTETVEAAGDAAAIRQALLLMSEIIRDQALSEPEALALDLTVTDGAGRPVWSGSARGGRLSRGAGLA